MYNPVRRWALNGIEISKSGKKYRFRLLSSAMLMVIFLKRHNCFTSVQDGVRRKFHLALIERILRLGF